MNCVGFGGVEPGFGWRGQDPSITKPLVCLTSIMELPPEPTVATEGKSIKGIQLEKGNESSLKSNPKRIFRANGNGHSGNLELSSYPIIEERAVSIVGASAYYKTG